jgi:hypothetical protein
MGMAAVSKRGIIGVRRKAVLKHTQMFSGLQVGFS